LHDPDDSNDNVFEVLGEGGHGPRPSSLGKPQLTFINDPHGAMKAAEQHYLSLDRRGQTGSHNQHYDINDIMRKFDGGEL